MFSCNLNIEPYVPEVPRFIYGAIIGIYGATKIILVFPYLCGHCSYNHIQDIKKDRAN